MNENSNFRMSRIYAQGWNAGNRLVNEAPADGLNPYPGGPERERWAEGFAAARGATNVLPFRNTKRMSPTTQL